MSETRYRTCDHCGKVLDEMRDYTQVEIDKYGLIVADLCVECYEKLSDMLTEYLHLKQGSSKS